MGTLRNTSLPLPPPPPPLGPGWDAAMGMVQGCTAGVEVELQNSVLEGSRAGIQFLDLRAKPAGFTVWLIFHGACVMLR